MKRYKLIPTKCSRCGNDFMTGKAVIFLPYEKKYIALCVICVSGLSIPSELIQKPQIKSEKEEEKRWSDFWNEEIK